MITTGSQQVIVSVDPMNFAFMTQNLTRIHSKSSLRYFVHKHPSSWSESLPCRCSRQPAIVDFLHWPLHQNKVAPVFPYKNIQAKPERPKVQVEVECTCRTSYNRTVKTAHTKSCCVKKKVDHRAKTKILAFHLDVAKVDIAKCGATYLQFYLVLILDIMLQNE